MGHINVTATDGSSALALLETLEQESPHLRCGGVCICVQLNPMACLHSVFESSCVLIHGVDAEALSCSSCRARLRQKLSKTRLSESSWDQIPICRLCVLQQEHYEGLSGSPSLCFCHAKNFTPAAPVVSEILTEFDVPFEVTIVSAHRTPQAQIVRSEHL